jgi:hypothetical protein
MVHLGKEMYCNIVDNKTEDIRWKLNYWYARAVKVKIVSVIDEELTLVV